MIGLLVFKERLKAFYARYNFYLNPALKFFYALAVFLLLNRQLGFLEKLNGPMFPLILGCLCAFLPLSATSFIAAVYMLAHLSGLSMELAVITGIFVVIAMILYGALQPGDSYLMVLTPVLFFLQIPYVVPLVVGLSCGIFSAIPMCFGIFLYYLLVYAKQNAGVLAGTAATDIAQKYGQVLKSIFSNDRMLLMVLAFALTVVVVFLIRNRSMAYAWTVAIAAGMVVELAVIFIGDSKLNVNLSIGSVALGALVSVLLAFVVQFFLFAVDYSRTEFLQYEDDDYYYYVKAVPKIAVSAPDIKVQRINKRNES